MLEARTGVGSIKSYPRPGVKGKLAAATPPAKSATGLQNKTFHCETCDVHVNSETQLKQVSQRERERKRERGRGREERESQSQSLLLSERERERETGTGGASKVDDLFQ